MKQSGHKWILLAAAVLLIAGVCVLYPMLQARQSKYTWQEESGGFSLAFFPLNQPLQASYALASGDSIGVAVVRNAGRLRIEIAREGKQPVYEGSDVLSGYFRVNISHAGTYTIMISGEEAYGSADFVLRRGAQDIETQNEPIDYEKGSAS